MLSFVLVLSTLLGLSASESPQAWSHHDESAWPGNCGMGSEQSPINIIPWETQGDPHGVHIRGPLAYRGYDDVLVTARNTGYKVRWALVPGTPAPTVSGGPLRGNYTFAEVHFHWLSEHAIDGIKSPLEIHLVHLKHGLTLPQALARPDGITVIGILAEVGTPNVSPVLDDLMPSVSQILTKSNEESQRLSVNIRQLFSPEPQKYYTYHGSLTTPLCAEAVTWIVMAKHTIVSHENYKSLTRVDLSGINNDRAVQPLGSRIVYRSMALPSCSSALSPSGFNALAALAACFGTKLTTTLLKGICKLAYMKNRLFGTAIPERCIYGST